MLSNDEVLELKNGTLELDCCFMKVIKKYDNQEFEFIGKGYIRQASNNRLSFKVFVQDGQTQNVIKAFQHRTKVGEIMIDEDYCTVFAVDQKNREWISEMVNSSYEVGKGAVLTGYLDEISFTKKIKARNKNKITFRIFDDLKVPSNKVTETNIRIGDKNVSDRVLNIASFSSGKYKFLIMKEQQIVKIEVELEKDEPIGNFIDIRVVEALEFVMGQSIAWDVLEKQLDEYFTIKIRSTHLNIALSPRLEPPIDFSDRDSTGDIWKLFHKYFEYVLTYNGNRYHPISEQIYQVREASQGSIIAEALALSVAVEGVLKSEYKDLCAQTDEFKSELKKACDYFDNWNGSEEAKKRVKGSLSSMNQLSPISGMNILIEKGIISNEQKKAWSKLRNPSAHGVQPDFEKKLKEFIKRCDIVYVLLYRLILNKIEYEGCYTDYSSENWPIKQFVSVEYLVNQPTIPGSAGENV